MNKDKSVLSNFTDKLCAIFPPFYYLYFITNRYVWSDQYSGEEKIAPVGLWASRVAMPLLGSTALFYTGNHFYDLFYDKMSSLIVEAYPSILGFAIGLYGIVISTSSFERMKNDIKEKGRLMQLSADMAYPLITMLSALILNSIFVLSDSKEYFAIGVFNVYSLFVLYDMIAAVYVRSLVK